MRRTACVPRPDWRARVEALGLVWHTAAAGPYWDESACYRLGASEVAEIEDATVELHRLFLAAGDHVVDHDLFAAFGVAPAAVPAIRAAWRAAPPALNWGRFDFGYVGDGPPKLFDFNCDTPTSLIEAAIVQWDWKECVHPALDQYNDLHDTLVAKWRDLAPMLPGDALHFAHARDRSGEDAVTVAYLRDTAEAAGLATRAVLMRDIGWSAGRGVFVDTAGEAMTTIFHLYPWEWLLAEPFAPMLLETLDRTLWIEPIWKTIWSNKAILAVLWELFPGHPNLLPGGAPPAGRGSGGEADPRARRGERPCRRDGATVASTGGRYGAGPWVYQELYPLRDFGAGYPMIGAWIVDGKPCGMGVREGGLITGDAARFVPHLIDN